MLEAIRATFPELDRWRTILASQVVPAPGSDLAEDDQAWLPMPTSSLARLGLGAAREHLHAMRLLMKAGEVFPSATGSLGRTALIGASLTIWMLKPDDHEERLRRSLSLALEDYTRHLQYGEQVLRSPELAQPTAAEEMARLRGRRAEAEALLETLGGRCSTNLSDSIIPAAVEVLGDELRPQVELQWRTMSGAVHALMWHHFGYKGTSARDVNEDRIGHITVGGDVERLVMEYFSGFQLAVAGWRLFAVRSGIPQLMPRIAASPADGTATRRG